MNRSIGPVEARQNIVATWGAQLRVRQWVKNGFVFVGVGFGHFWSPSSLARAAVAFVAFCFVSSAVYILNDIVDVEADRVHPQKSRRPLALGAITRRSALFATACLLAAAAGLGLMTGGLALAILGSYLILNVIYSAFLKKVPIADVFAIALGFMLRIFMGTSGIGIAPSNWLLLCSFLLTLFLGFAKRKSELGPAGGHTAAASAARPVLASYSRNMLDQFLAITAAGAVIAYSIYTVSDATIAMHGTSNLYLTVPIVIFGLLRYLWIVEQPGRGSDAAEELLSDQQLIFTLAAWIAATLCILWLA